MGHFPKVRSSLLDEPGIELLSWALLTLSSNCQPGRQAGQCRGRVWEGAQLLSWEPAEPEGELGSLPASPSREGVVMCAWCCEHSLVFS